MDHKRIFLFTNDDDPLKGNADETKKVHMIAQASTPPVQGYLTMTIVHCCCLVVMGTGMRDGDVEDDEHM